MIEKKEFTLTSLHNERPFLLDLRYEPTGKPKPVVLFIHGFKGFKDWGPFNLIADLFAKAGFVYAKLNLSHNGTTLEKPLDFADLEAFGQNNYLIELDDIKIALDFLDGLDLQQEAQLGQYSLVGHSRGGGLVILKAREDERVSKVVTWAGKGDYSIGESDARLKQWQQEGVAHIWNGRTGQQMPIYYQFYKALLANSERLSIEKAASELQAPLLLIHGTGDETVPLKEAETLKQAQPKAELMAIEEALHTFGGAHPFEGESLPDDLQKAVDATIEFFKKPAYTHHR